MPRYWKFIRPFTLLVPASGMIAGALMALGAHPKWTSPWSEDFTGILVRIVVGAFLGAALNAYSNGINQIYDVEVDRVNKPHRMLPSGKMSEKEAWGISLVFLIISLLLAGWINWQCFSIVFTAALLTTAYSAPPLRTKSRGIWANITIAIPRGTLLIVCGWSTVKSVVQPEPWLIGGIFGLFFLGAATTKDFSDIEGDRLGRCETLPVVYGIEKAIRIIRPFLIFPFLFILPLVGLGALTARTTILVPLGILLPAWGLYVSRLLVRTSSQLVQVPDSGRENHPSWIHMYLLTLLAQFGFAAAYLAS